MVSSVTEENDLMAIFVCNAKKKKKTKTKKETTKNANISRELNKTL